MDVAGREGIPDGVGEGYHNEIGVVSIILEIKASKVAVVPPVGVARFLGTVHFEPVVVVGPGAEAQTGYFCHQEQGQQHSRTHLITTLRMSI